MVARRHAGGRDRSAGASLRAEELGPSATQGLVLKEYWVSFLQGGSSLFFYYCFPGTFSLKSAVFWKVLDSLSKQAGCTASGDHAGPGPVLFPRRGAQAAPHALPTAVWAGLCPSFPQPPSHPISVALVVPPCCDCYRRRWGQPGHRGDVSTSCFALGIVYARKGPGRGQRGGCGGSRQGQ